MMERYNVKRNGQTVGHVRATYENGRIVWHAFVYPDVPGGEDAIGEYDTLRKAEDAIRTWGEA